MIKLITYTDANMDISAEICKESALLNNVDCVKIYTSNDIHQEFKDKNKSILSAERGAGYWLWKPYIILNELLNSKDGDYIIYSDAGVEIINNIKYIIDCMEGDVFLFGNIFRHSHWCKADIMTEMIGKRTIKRIEDNRQIQASVILFKASEYTRELVKEWLSYCTKPGYIDDSPSLIQNHVEFREHRHDQAILTNIAIRKKIKLHYWPATYNGGMFNYEHTFYPDDKYPIIFHHHRFRNDQFYNNFGIDKNINQHYWAKKNYSILKKIWNVRVS
jgi:hypothetical protein